MIKSQTTRYVIAKGSQFLIDLYKDTAYWSCVPHDCLITGRAWLDHASASAELRGARKALRDPSLTLTMVKLERTPQGTWEPVHQVGVKA